MSDPARPGAPPSELTISWYTTPAHPAEIAEILRIPRAPLGENSPLWHARSYILPIAGNTVQYRLYIDVHQHEDRAHWFIGADELPDGDVPDGVPLADDSNGGTDAMLRRVKEALGVDHITSVTSEVAFSVDSNKWHLGVEGLSGGKDLIVAGQAMVHFGHAWRARSSTGSMKAISAFTVSNDDLLITIKSTVDLRVTDNLVAEAESVAWIAVKDLLCPK